MGLPGAISVGVGAIVGGGILALAGVAFAMFTVCNLLPRAIANHHWYREQFSDYPTDRKILLPGIF